MVSAGALFNFISAFLYGGIVDTLRIGLHPEGGADSRANRSNRVCLSTAAQIGRIFAGIFAGDLWDAAAGDVLF